MLTFCKICRKRHIVNVGIVVVATITLVLFLFRLRNLKARDDAKIANAQAKNSVESFLFETRDKLSDEEGETLMTEEEREKVETVLSEVSEWLDDEGWDTTEDVSVTGWIISVL